MEYQGFTEVVITSRVHTPSAGGQRGNRSNEPHQQEQGQQMNRIIKTAVIAAIAGIGVIGTTNAANAAVRTTPPARLPRHAREHQDRVQVLAGQVQ